jgi:hypothetical protein
MAMKRGLPVAVAAALLMGLAGTANAEDAARAGPPAADAPADTARMRRAMHAYFHGELNEAWAFGTAGIVTVGGGSALLAANDGLYRGAAFPLAIVGVVQLAAGIVLLARTDAQVAELDRRLDLGKSAFLGLEQPRMQKVRAEFGLLAVTELALMVAGIGLAAYGGARHDHPVTGIGGGLALQSAAMLAFDAQASTRADTYAAAIDAYAR